MDSSPDLSLKLRRGSSDSRDTFYMDFAQGIDSDIEEVDNSVNTREPQQPPTPPPPMVAAQPLLTDDDLAALAANIPPPMMLPPPMLHQQQPQPLPTLNETDDLPPTPPPHHLPSTSTSVVSSPPLSPTSSVLEMIPPPPLSPPPKVPKHATRAALPPSPPLETEDEADEGDVDEEPDEEDDDDDDDDKSTTPPALPPLPSNLSYVHGNGAHGPALPSAPVSPPLTKSPSTSPSPPDTPPPCSKLSKMVSPPPPPMTPPSESDQSQPNSPPPLPHHAMKLPASPPTPQPDSPRSDREQRDENIEDIGPSTPPPEFGEVNDMVTAVLAAAVEATPQELVHAVLQDAAYHVSQEKKDYIEDEPTTNITPPCNGYSTTSIIAPPAEHRDDLEDDIELVLADIPPPAGLEDDEPEEDTEEDEAAGEKTPVSEQQPEDAASKEQISETKKDVGEVDNDDEAEAEEEPGTPTPQATPTASGSPKRRSISSRGPSRSVSRSGSHSGSRNASRSGSVRGSIGSRAGSIAAASVASAAASIASVSSQVAAATAPAVPSPQASIKSLRSPPSLKSALSKPNSPPSLAPILKSPPEADSPPLMPSPPMMRSPPAPMKSPPPLMHSPPRVTSPPRVYSPPLIGSPPVRKSEIDAIETDKPKEIAEKRTATTESLPSTSAAAASETTVSAAPVVVTAAAATAAVAVTPTAAAATSTTLSFQDEHVVRPHLSSHHHYHLPHQFQHPHHQNHHTHTHGSMPVPTPTVPASFARHIRAASGSGGGGAGGGGGGAGGGGGGIPDDDNASNAGAPALPLLPPPSGRRSPPTALAAPSPNLLLSSETVSHASVSPAKSSTRMRDSTSHHRVTIDESTLPGGGGGGGGDDGSEPPSPGSSSQHQLAHGGSGDGDDDRQTGHLALMYHSHQLTSYPVLPAIKRGTMHRPSFIYPPMPRVKAGDALATLFSALYGKLLVVMGVAFPMAEVISTYIPPSFYEVYYLYLYIGSMIFLFFMYATLIWGRPKIPVNIASPTKSAQKARSSTASESMDESDTDSNSTRNKRIPSVVPSARRPSLLAPLGRQHHYGSFYLRMGAVAFGIGSMIYSGLEFGQYFELNPDTKCHNVLLALTPATRMAFIFIQMYFIFLNNEQIKVYRYKIIARFGLMHMIGTNLAVWLNVLIQETKHEILTFYNPENRTLRISHRIPGHSRGHAIAAAADPTAHLRVPRGLKGPYQIFECRRTNILGTLVQDASAFLFPCTIEYSLICAAILYVMWRSISRPQTPTPQRPDTISSPMKRSPHHYSVDCARAHKGLFVGILILVLTIISLILFFVLISRPDFVSLAVTEVTICELLIYCTATIATIGGMIQIRHLQYDAYRSFSLDDILLVGAQTGSFLYNIFTVIAGQFTLKSDDMLVPLNALASIVQTACQTMFILDASRRQAVSPAHIRKKPGREIVTFMLVVNLAMWAISTLEKSRAESHPIQLNFYGLWAWTIITHVSMPLAIFYRFHSTVCLCEIWKRAYKLKPTYM